MVAAGSTVPGRVGCRTAVLPYGWEAGSGMAVARLSQVSGPGVVQQVIRCQ